MKRILIITLIFTLVLLPGCCERMENKQNVSTTAEGYGYNLHIQRLPARIELVTAQYEMEEGQLLGGLSVMSRPVFGFKPKEGIFNEIKLPNNIDYIYAITKQGEDYSVLAGDKPKNWRNVDGGQINEQEKYVLYILIYTKDGKLKDQLPLNGKETAQGESFFSLLNVEGVYYLLSRHIFVQCDATGKESAVLSHEWPSFFGQCLYNNKLILGQTDRQGYSSLCRVLSSSDISLDEVTRISGHGAGIAVGTNGELLYNDTDGLYTLSGKKYTKELICHWGDLGISNGGFLWISEKEDGFTIGNPNSDELFSLRYGPLEEKREKLVLWTYMQSGVLSSLVNRFNATNTKYYVSVKECNFDEQDRLNAEIIAGKGPDILWDGFATGLKFENLFENLLPYLDNDSEFDRDCLAPGLLEASMRNDCVYKLPISFMLYTARVPANLGLKPGVTMDEFLKAAKLYAGNLPPFASTSSRLGLFAWCCNLCYTSFVDLNTGTCHFDTDEYAALLQAYKDAPINGEPGADYQEGLLEVDQIGSIMRLWYLSDTYGENYIYLGLPCGKNSNGSAFDITQSVSISAFSNHKDGAWEFIRSALGATDLYSNLGFPAPAKAFDSLMEKAVTDGVKEYGDLNKIRPYDVEQLRATMSAATSIMDKYPELIDIMCSEAESFFAGDKSAKETANITQSRASLYLAEQYN